MLSIFSGVTRAVFSLLSLPCLRGKPMHIPSSWAESKLLTALLLVSVALRPAKGSCLPCVGSQSSDAQYMAQSAHFPEWISTHIFSIFQVIQVWLLLFLSYSIPCVSFLQTLLYRSLSDSFQLVFNENCSTCRCISDLFMEGGELHIFSLQHHDPNSLKWFLKQLLWSICPSRNA